MTKIARVSPDGRLTDIAIRARHDGDVEVDEVVPHRPGDPLVRDPLNPRRAIVSAFHVATYAEEQKAARRRQAQLDLYAERMVRASMLRAGRPSSEVQAVEARIAGRKAKIIEDM